MPNGEYKKTAAGYELPAAHKDNFGGRPGLDNLTRFANSIDDPTPGDLDAGYAANDAGKSILRAAPVLVASRVSELPVPAPIFSPDLLPPPAKVDAVAPVSDSRNVSISTDDIRELLLAMTKQTELLSQAQTIEESKPLVERDVVVKPDVSTDTLSPTYISVIIEGEFGRFRSKAADVVICENHIAILYTAEVGDDDLLFEPPLDKTFNLKVQLEDSSYKTHSVRHFGLITRLPTIGVLVTLPFATEVNNDEQELNND